MQQTSYGTLTITDTTDIARVQNWYLASSSSSGVQKTDSGWTTDVTNANATMTATKQYLWNYEQIQGEGANGNYITISTTDPVIIGRYGQNGGTGAAGRGITSIDEYYQATNSTNKPGSSGWQKNTLVAPTSTKPYLWNYQVINYTNPTSTQGTYNDARIIGVYGDKGDKGDKGDAGRTYFLELSNNVIKKDANNTLTPASITIKAYYRDGTGTKTAYSGRMVIIGNKSDNTTTTISTVNGSSTSLTANATYVSYTINLYEAGGTTNLFATETLPILSDIENLQIGGRNLYIVKNQVAGFISGSGTISGASSTMLEKTSEYIAVSASEHYIFQTWCPDLASNQQMWIAYQFYSNNIGTVVGGRTSKYGTAGEKYLAYDNITVPSGATYIRVSYCSWETGYAKLEKGNKATDWTPAPEDTDNAINTVETNFTTTSNGIYSEIKKNSENNQSLEERLTEIQATLNNIKLQVSSITNNKNFYVGENISSYTTEEPPTLLNYPTFTDFFIWPICNTNKYCNDALICGTNNYTAHENNLAYCPTNDTYYIFKKDNAGEYYWDDLTFEEYQSISSKYSTINIKENQILIISALNSAMTELLITYNGITTTPGKLFCC